MTEARVYYDEDGNLILEDPALEGVIAAVEHHNRSLGKQACLDLFEESKERVEYFKQRFQEKGLSPKEAVIVLLNVDDPFGGGIADVLMPGHDWQSYRDMGQVPIARGLAVREGIFEAVQVFDPYALRERLLEEGKIDVVVVTHGVARVFQI